MKKAFALLLAALVLVSAGAALAGDDLANSWVETTADGLMEALGLRLGIPEGAENVAWRMLESEQLGEVRFAWQGENYVARIAPRDEFEDISGLYCDWHQQAECSVGRCDGICRRATDGDATVDLCLWYDDLTGLMYSVSVVGEDLYGFDIQAAADILYVPMQTE